ncbi:MAG TPA: hypothetical protein VIE87_05475 [Pseudolabrys sp.]|jgi:hypothetical protein
MNLRRTLLIAACLLPGAAGTAAAQFQPPAQPRGEPPPCIKEFLSLRDAASQKASAIRTASARHASANEACALFNSFSAAEAKMIKYAEDNAVWCGMPPQVLVNIKKEHAKTSEIRTKVCQAAAAPARPAAPSLSDALGAPIPDANNIKTGRGGTYDTLTGPPIGK